MMPARYIGSPGQQGGDDALLYALMQKRQMAMQQQRPHWAKTLGQSLMTAGQLLQLQKARLKAEQAQLKYQEELLEMEREQAGSPQLSQMLGARRDLGAGVSAGQGAGASARGSLQRRSTPPRGSLFPSGRSHWIGGR